MPKADSDDDKQSEKCYTKFQWLGKLNKIEIYENDLQNLIMNYFTVNGYQNAAEAFHRETFTKPEMPLNSIGCRKAIRSAVLNGNMEEATDLINSIDTNILEKNSEINFRLKKQQLLQIIEKGEFMAAVEFAQTYLAPCVKQNPSLLPQLEEAMSLLAFGSIKCKAAQKVLKDIQQNDEAAQTIDEAILEYYNIDQEPTLENVIKNLLFTQPAVREARCRIPILKDVVKGIVEHSGDCEEYSDVNSDT